MINRSTEDYLKGIYALQNGNENVSTSDLAGHLKISDGSVTGMVKKLSRKRLLRYEPYRGVRLTEDGKRLALKMIRRHRLWEMFLVRFLQYSWDEIHDEAERLEHVTSDKLEERLDRVLGHPTVDPHGDPIPSASGEMAEIDSCDLTRCEINQRGVIVRVRDGSQEMLRLMTRLGLDLHTTIVIKDKLAIDGSVIVGFPGRSVEIPLSPKIAQSISVQIL